MIKRIFLTSAMVWVGLLTCVAYATTESPETLVQRKLSAIRTMHAHFSQTIRAKHRLIASSSGVMVLARPNRFRWQTKQPMAQTVVADGKNVWIYDVELEQVTVSKQTQKLGAAGALFLSQSDDAVRRDFTVTSVPHQSMDVFDLHAKSPKSNFERVRLRFKGDVLSAIELDDQLGQHTVIHLSAIRINQPEPARLFQFHAPVGVDVVHQ